MNTSLIITTYEWPRALDLTLHSVVRQTVLPREVVIADDGSGPETAALVHQWRRNFPVPLHHVWQPHQGMRLARSRNAAIAKSRGQYILLADGDMVLHPSFVEDHHSLARPHFFIQGCRLLTHADTAQRMLDECILDLGFFAKGIDRRHHTVRSAFLSRLFSRERTDQRAIRGCNQGYWRTDLARVNGFNERMVGWGREDNEIAERLYNVGVVRRNVKFMALATHLYHARRHPQGVNPNDAVLRETIERKLTRCRLGLDGHHGVRVATSVVNQAWRDAS
jgi:glycosyltransferase involved in cell wall biosynthesis